MLVDIIDVIIKPFLEIQSINVLWSTLNISLHSTSLVKPFFARFPLPRVHGQVINSKINGRPFTFKLQYLNSRRTSVFKIHGVAEKFFQNNLIKSESINRGISNCEAVFIRPIKLPLTGALIKFIKPVRKYTGQTNKKFPIMATA